MKFTVVLLFITVQVSLAQNQQKSPPKTVDIKDQLLSKILGKTWQSLRYVGAAPIENYNHYSFLTENGLFKQRIEDGRKIANDKFTWSLTKDADRNLCYLTITDNITKEVIIYCFDQWNSAIVNNKLFFKSDFDDDLTEELFLNN